MSAPDLSKQVQQLLEDLDLFRLPVVPKEVCSRLGVEYREIPYQGVEGTLLVIGSQQLIGVNSNTREHSRKAFTCAHELGHYYFDLGSNDSCSSTCLANDVSDNQSHNPRELQANEFAAELLMPKTLFEPLIRKSRPSWGLIQKLAEECGTSIQATAQRYIQLSRHTCWFAVVRGGQIQRYQKPARSPFHLNVGRKVIVPQDPPKHWEKVSAHAWMGHVRHTRARTLAQSFWPENRYGDTLALLWDNQGDFYRRTFGEKMRFAAFWILALVLVILYATCVHRAGQ